MWGRRLSSCEGTPVAVAGTFTGAWPGGNENEDAGTGMNVWRRESASLTAGEDPDYPQDVQAAEQRLHAQQGYGGWRQVRRSPRPCTVGTRSSHDPG